MSAGHSEQQAHLNDEEAADAQIAQALQPAGYEPSIDSITEDVTPEDVTRPNGGEVQVLSRRPLKPKEWDRRAIAMVSLFVYTVVILAVLIKLLFFGAIEGVSVSMVISTAVASFSMIVGFYFGSTAK